MKFPEKYIRRGNFRLRSGQSSKIFYDVNALLTDDFYVRRILNSIPIHEHYVGIATAGEVIARLVALERNVACSIVKDGELKGKSPVVRDWLLIDDVVTTGGSLEEAVLIIGKIPKEIWAVLDRRPQNVNPKVTSLYDL